MADANGLAGSGGSAVHTSSAICRGSGEFGAGWGENDVENLVVVATQGLYDPALTDVPNLGGSIDGAGHDEVTAEVELRKEGKEYMP